MTQPASPEHGLLTGFSLDGTGGAQQVDLDTLERAAAAGKAVWGHFDRRSDGVERWLREHADIAPATCDAMLSEDTRPRARVCGGGIILILRALDLSAGGSPENMVSLRLWVDSRRALSFQLRPVDSVKRVAEKLADGTGPSDPCDVLTDLAEAVLDRLEPVLDRLDEQVDALEQELESTGLVPSSGRLSRLRRELAIYYRHLRPQRAALAHLASVDYLSWLEAHDAAELHEAAERTARMTEDLEELRERANLIQEERQRRLSDELNKRMYVSAVAAAVFLPLTFLTGLLGVNVGGIPWSSDGNGFLIVCVGVVLLGGVEVWLLRRLGWLGAADSHSGAE